MNPQMDSPSDQDLMRLLAGGDTQALTILVRRHQQQVLSLATRLLGRVEDAQDITQQTFVRVWRAAPDWRDEALFTTWLYLIVVNLCRDARRAALRRPAPAYRPASTDLPATPDRAPIERDEQARIIRQAIDALPQRQRTALILQRYQGLNHTQVAQATGWSVSAVESLLVRAYANLRPRLRDLWENAD